MYAKWQLECMDKDTLVKIVLLQQDNIELMSKVLEVTRQNKQTLREIVETQKDTIRYQERALNNVHRIIRSLRQQLDNEPGEGDDYSCND